MEPSTTTVDGLSPREKFTRRGINYKRDLRAAFGDYVQVQVPMEETNGMEARTEGAIAVLPTGNLQGSVKFYLLRTNRIVTRDQWVPLPMPQVVIDHLNNPMSRDPAFAAGEKAVDDIDTTKAGLPAQEPIHGGHVRIVRSHCDLAEPTSEPMVEASHISVLQAAGDISESLVTEQSLGRDSHRIARAPSCTRLSRRRLRGVTSTGGTAADYPQLQHQTQGLTMPVCIPEGLHNSNTDSISQ